MENKKDKCISKKKGVIHWIWLAAAIGYTISPLDFVPDTIPILGWLDDFSFLSAAVLNILQYYQENTHRQLAAILKYLKWIFLFLAILLVLLFGIFGFLLFFNK